MMFIFLGAMGKSAQVPFHVWLPDAMEGPTPVSALIHAATMVVAGVYLVARLLPIFEVAEGALLVVTFVGLITALFSGVVAFAQTDIKKVLAYSTVSQLGFMFVALGTGLVGAGMFHLFTHAFFKALLFLGAGSVIIGSHHRQEMGQLGGLWRKMPITATTFLIGSLALAGLFPLAGFWSKDEILHVVDSHRGAWAYVLISVAAIMTAIYTTRLFVRTFLGQPQDAEIHSHTRETGPIMTLPLVFLAILSIVAGLVVFNGVGDAIGFPGGFPEFVFLHEPERFHVDWGLVGFSSALFVIGTFGAAWIYWRGRLDRATAAASWQPQLYEMVQRKFYFDDLYQFGIDRGVLGLSYLVSWFDRFAVNDTGARWLREHDALHRLRAQARPDWPRAELRHGDRRRRGGAHADHAGGQELAHGLRPSTRLRAAHDAHAAAGGGGHAPVRPRLAEDGRTLPLSDQCEPPAGPLDLRLPCLPGGRRSHPDGAALGLDRERRLPPGKRHLAPSRRRRHLLTADVAHGHRRLRRARSSPGSSSTARKTSLS